MPRINAERLLGDLRTLREFGAASDHPRGVIRVTYSDADMAARTWLASKFEAAGLDATIDGVGNVFGRSRQQGRAMLLGSHTDTQPRGGWLDGAMGVIYGLEVARCLREDPATSHLAVDVISFADEEGTYLGMIGSRSFCGVLDETEIATAVGNAGATGSEPLPAALERAGVAGRALARYEPGRYVGFLEAHIEQGPYLEKGGNSIGVVTGIVGIRGATLRCEGEQVRATVRVWQQGLAAGPGGGGGGCWCGQSV
jgi:N-carbamoyl-L-amino-acid hydrolase